MHHPRRSSSGFTLIEMLVAVALFALVIIGLLQFLDTSTKLSKTESALADTQENVRYATYHLVRMVRMTGGGSVPFVQNTGSAASPTWGWAAGQMVDNSAGTATTLLGNVANVKPGTDVLTISGFFEEPPFFVTPNDISTSGSNVTIEVVEANNPAVSVWYGATNPFQGKGVVMMGRQQYAVGEVNSGGTQSTNASGQDILQLPAGTGATMFQNMNEPGVGWPPTFGVARVGILDTYVYYVRDDDTLMRIRSPRNPSSDPGEPVAINIGGLQVALGVDTDDDAAPNVWQNTNPTAAGIADNRVVAIRLNVLGRIDHDVSGWTEPLATLSVENMNSNLFNRNTKWRRMQVVASLRNYIL